MSMVNWLVGRATWTALATALGLVSCSSGTEQRSREPERQATGGTRMPGNEAIPDIGKLSIGGTSTTGNGDRSATAGGDGVGSATVANGGNAPASMTSASGGASSSSGMSSSSIGGRMGEPSSNRGGVAGSAIGSSGIGAGGQASLPSNGTTAMGGASGRGGANSLAAAGTKASAGSESVAGTSSGSGSYHTLANWLSPSANNANHHGRSYFIANRQKDDQGIACNSCHGANLEGTSDAPSCASCHSNWRSCDFCHGQGATQFNPPHGVFGETSISTLAVGRHAAHLSAGNSHTAFPCASCHTVPAANDLAHIGAYAPSVDLSTTGHHGDVLFSGPANGTVWDVGAVSGSPASARGTCIGACHSNGRGGSPAKTPYWAGGTWTSNCTNCHAATGSTGSRKHGHGFPGSTCGDCHTGATTTSYTSATHMNGTRDFKTSPGGAAAGARLTANFSCSNVSCHD